MLTTNQTPRPSNHESDSQIVLPSLVKASKQIMRHPMASPER